jgi:hypothetical protein
MDGINPGTVEFNLFLRKEFKQNYMLIAEF